MIKEKHEKSSDSTKSDEAASSDKDTHTGNTEVRVKKEDDINVNVKKEPTTAPITVKNGGIVGSTNTGSLQPTITDRKIENDDSVNSSNTEISLPVPLKQEDGIESDGLGDAFGLGLGLGGGNGNAPPPEGVQPLASNVVNKQHANSVEVQYMQQQSQIFVFSTMLANTGADEVLQGRYPSIIAYHCAQPGTKKYLEKNPLKITQFNRQHPAQWLNNIAMVKNKGCTRSPGLGSKPPPSLDNFLSPDGLDDMVGLGDGDAPWEQKNNHLDGLDTSVTNGLPEVGPDMDSCSPSLTNVQPKLQGVQVPDENLTPQQRQHREEQLATMRKLQQMLFPESSQGGGGVDGVVQDPTNTNLPPGQQLPLSAQVEWQKLQHQFFEDRTKIKSGQSQGGLVPVGPVSGGSGPSQVPTSGGNRVQMPGLGPRLQGPPPPYHQTPRSASVPIALQSPNPTSPNNPTSNLSLPSPRASSALNSPAADPARQFGLSRHMSTGQSPTSQDSPSAPARLHHSNPSTPLSSHHLSPSVTSSNNNINANTEAISTHQSSVDGGMFGRTLQSMAQQKQQLSTTSTCSTTLSSTPGSGKEPNLMPVPSPQQIQYLNTFEGQELIIQKQPNTSLKEGNIISPPVLPTSMDSSFSGNTSDIISSRVSGPNTPTSMDVGPRFPPTPGVSSDGCRFQIASPHTPNTVSVDKPQRLSGPGSSTIGAGMSPQAVSAPASDPLKNDLFPAPNKVSHFDPIQSLAQMSQQLTNSVPNSLNGQGNQGPPPMMNFGSTSMHMIDMGACHGMGDMDQSNGNMMGMPMQGFHPNSPMGPIRSLSPKLPGAFPNHMPMPRMMGRPPGPNPYNGANVQVKPNAPNTIQYLPAKSQVGVAPVPRGPPSLDFLTRLATPINMLEGKMSNHQNMQYFPNCGPNNGPMQGPPHMVHMDGGPGMVQDGPMGHMGPMGAHGHMGNGAGPMMGMMPIMRGGPAGMRPMMRMPQMGFNGPPGGPDSGMFNPGPPHTNMGNPNAQMFVSGPKGSPMGISAPDTTQPLPPSMGQNNNFKNNTFVGPSTNDPNYAQQFHNFQQQLYATNTRSQMGAGPGPPSASQPPHMQQPPYFNPK